MTLLKGFPPIINRKSKVLILGSMPGVRSLRDKQYYAHPQNVFWKIIKSIYQVYPTTYSRQKKIVLDNHIAIWDVVQSCNRKGSLDNDIRDIQINDFNYLFERYKSLKHILFNGSMSYSLFMRKVKRDLDIDKRGIFCQKLPSTSPANARMTYEEKFTIWKEAILSSLVHKAR